MTIAKAEDWLIGMCRDVLGDGMKIVSVPGEWDGSFTHNLLDELPAVGIAFSGGEAKDGTSLTLDATWSLFVFVGWQGKDEQFRRRGDASTKGIYAIVSALAYWLHNCEPRPDPIHVTRHRPARRQPAAAGRA